VAGTIARVPGPSPREIAVRILQRHARGGAFIEELLDDDRDLADLPPADRALVQEICCGCVRWRGALDWLIKKKTDNREQHEEVLAVLRVGLYQLLWLDRVPPHAAVHETVEAGRALLRGAEPGFVNAILRAYARELDATRAGLAELKLRHPAAGWSHPGWLVVRWRTRYGTTDTQKLLEWNNTPPSTYARLNSLRGDPGAVLEAWRVREDVQYDFCRFDWTPENLFFRLRSHPPLARLRSFRDGGFYLQDPSTALAVTTLAPKPGERILDACAAPGGKTTLIAQLVENAAVVVAEDVQEPRLALLRENCQRLGASCVEIRARRAGAPDPAPFDAVLVDAPCSNTGVMRRRIDLRWRIQEAELGRLRGQQLDLLAQAARRVRPGGRVIYSTCSIEPEENEQVVKDFLAAHPNFVLAGERTLLPFRDGVDGAYAAKLVRL
jgi:16S rRNA (cytosine967-C5)-methyltransferase